MYFYKGEIAEKIVRCSEKTRRTFHGQRFCRSSFGLGRADHRRTIAAMISTRCRRPRRDFVALEMLKILEGFDLKSAGPQSADALHLMIEAKKLAFADRDRHLADRDFMKVRCEIFSRQSEWKKYAVADSPGSRLQ